MKLRFFRWAVIFIVLLFILILAIGMLIHQPRPVTNASQDAENLALKMANVLNKEAWDSTRYVRWNFIGLHQYFWDKQRNFVEVKWKNIAVYLFTDSVSGIVHRKSKKLTSPIADKYLNKAWKYFCNDSFWLFAPLKLDDPGTKRGIVNFDDGRKGLLISYTTGGVTPGDTYLWILNDKGLPEGWKMWVSVIPVGGLEVKWENWKTFTGGTRIATTRKVGPFRMHFEDIQMGNTLDVFGFEKDPFELLEKSLKTNHLID